MNEIEITEDLLMMLRRAGVPETRIEQMRKNAEKTA